MCYIHSGCYRCDLRLEVFGQEAKEAAPHVWTTAVGILGLKTQDRNNNVVYSHSLGGVRTIHTYDNHSGLFSAPQNASRSNPTIDIIAFNSTVGTAALHSN